MLFFTKTLISGLNYKYKIKKIENELNLEYNNIKNKMKKIEIPSSNSPYIEMLNGNIMTNGNKYFNNEYNFKLSKGLINKEVIRLYEIYFELYTSNLNNELFTSNGDLLSQMIDNNKVLVSYLDNFVLDMDIIKKYPEKNLIELSSKNIDIENNNLIEILKLSYENIQLINKEFKNRSIQSKILSSNDFNSFKNKFQEINERINNFNK